MFQMLHVWDHFDHTNDVAWWKEQGWPLLKVTFTACLLISSLSSVRLISDIAPTQGVAGFHLDKLMPDLHFNDSTLVVNPCNSPEQNPITFGACGRCSSRAIR